MSQRTAAVIGAGIGGLTTALALLRTGWRVRVFEQAAALGEAGAGISLSTGAAAGLASLGLGPSLLRVSLPVTRLAFVHFRTGEVLSAGDGPASAAADPGLTVSRHVHRADLHSLLVEAVRAIDAEAVTLDRRLVRIEKEERVAAHFADGSREAADVLIAADGVRSAARRELFGDGAPRFAGQIAFRCLLPRAPAERFLSAGPAVVSIGGGRVFHRYPIRGGTVLNVVGIAQSDAWPHEGWNTPASAEEFLALYRDFHADVTGLIRLASAPHLIKWGLFNRPPLERWCVGRAALLGDAAHPVLPFLGLGAALAIEDAIVASRALEAFTDVESALESYQATRRERVERVRLASIRQGEIIQTAQVSRDSVSVAPAGDASLFDFDPCRCPLLAAGPVGPH